MLILFQIMIMIIILIQQYRTMYGAHTCNSDLSKDCLRIILARNAVTIGVHK